MGRDGAAPMGASDGRESDSSHPSTSEPLQKHPWRWHPSRSRPDESDSHPSWLRRRRHLLILSDAGKPLWSRYGDEGALAGFTAALSAIVSFVGDDGDALRSVGSLGRGRTAGDKAGGRPHEMTVLRRGPIILVAVTSTGESPAALRRQLHLLHAQLLALLTRAVERALEKSSKFDARERLLGGGTESLFGTLAHSFTWDPGTWTRAWLPLPLPTSWREMCTNALRDALVRGMGGVGEGALVGALITARHVVAVANADPKAGKRSSSSSSSSSSSRATTPASSSSGYYAGIDPDDVILLCNTVRSSASFRRNPESFAPVCLPNRDANRFVYAYVSYLGGSTPVGERDGDEPGGPGFDSQAGKHVCLVLVSTRQDAFPAAAEARGKVEERMLREGLLDRISARVGGKETQLSDNHVRHRTSEQIGDAIPGSLLINRDIPEAAGGGDVANTPLLHFLYLRPLLGQYLTPDWSPPLSGRREQKRLLRAYQRVFHSMRRCHVSGDASVKDWDEDPFRTRERNKSSSGDGAETGSPLAAFFGGLRLTGSSSDKVDADVDTDVAATERRVHYEVSDDHVLLGCVGSDFELYVALDPLTQRGAAVAVCNRLCTWLRAEEAGLFATC